MGSNVVSRMMLRVVGTGAFSPRKKMSKQISDNPVSLARALPVTPTTHPYLVVPAGKIVDEFEQVSWNLCQLHRTWG